MDPIVRQLLDDIAAGMTAHELERENGDFKEDDRSAEHTVKLLVDASLCFANASGGTIVLGVANAVRGPTAFTGTDLDPDFVKRRIYELTVPGLLVEVEETFASGRRLLIIRVTEAVEIHADTQGRAPRRVGSDCRPMTPAQQAQLRQDRQGIDWSAQVSARTLSEVSTVAVEKARELLAGSVDPTRRGYARLSTPDMIAALELVEPSGTLLRAGELLLCPPARSGHPQIVYQYRATPAGEPRAVERLEAPLLTAYERVMDLVSARRNLTPLTLPGGQQLQLEDFPELAVREALANAIIHRDHRLTDPVVIEHSPTLFSVTSPGPLVPGVTLENILTHRSKPRNPTLARAARLLGIAEEVGRGVDRMYREMIRSGRDVPRIEGDFDEVRVALAGTAPDTQVARYVATLPESERDDTDTMLVLLHLLRKRTVTAEQIWPVLQRDVDQAETVLRRLESPIVRMLEPTRETAGRRRPTYRLREEVLNELGTSVPYRRRTTDEIDRKVIAHVREYDRVTNRTVQNLLDVGVDRAKAILADLVGRGILVKTSAAQRGPSVEYGPGARFPAERSRPGRRTRPISEDSAQAELPGLDDGAPPPD
jgi:ATP-dependent DNA helicase RecG